MRIYLLILLTFLTYWNTNAQCTLACYADINISLDASGNASISPEHVLASYGPSCGTLIVEPSSFDCSDIGAPIMYTVTDLASGNFCWGYIHVKYFVGAMACYANLNVSLPPSGTMTLTPEMLLFDPPGACIPGAIISPSTVSCADIGAPVVVTITDPVSGNSCWTHVTVSYNVTSMACYADLNVSLPPSGTMTLTPEMLLYDPPGACIPGAIISPSTVSCADIDAPVLVTITDPVSGNSCWSHVTVNDPRPASCEIIVPATIYCGDAGVPFSVLVTGGYGPFDYFWQIKGNDHGWSVLTGQGTDYITMAVGDNSIKLEVTITDICGKKRKCSVKVACEESAAMRESNRIVFNETSREEGDNGLEIFPNPATESLWVKYPGLKSSAVRHLSIVDQFGRPQVIVRDVQLHRGNISMDINDLAPGIYFLVLEDAVDGPLIKKFIKL